MSQLPKVAGEFDESQVIRITPEDANSSHVDDLLRRHASLRGEQGITRDRSRRWYLQNWFVFMIAGALGALAAYALLNPFFDEHLYVSGKVTAINVSPTSTIKLMEDGTEVDLPPDHYIDARIGSHLIAFAPGTRWRQSDGKYGAFNVGDLAVDQTLGVYVDYLGDSSGEHSIARFVIPGPRRMVADAPLSDQLRNHLVSQVLMFPLIAAFIGLFIGAADGFMCRLPRRFLLGGAIGLVFGLVGGFFSWVLAEVVYGQLTHLARAHPGALGFGIQTAGRGIAWTFAGACMGLGQGIALRSKRLLLYGFLGGLIGGLLGGLLFDPIDILIMGTDKPSSSLSRWIGFGTIGLVVGLMIGLVELLARDAWLRMTAGPLVGKEFLIFKDIMRMGSSPRSEIYLFNDPAVAPQHAVIRTTGDIIDIENSCREAPVCVNGRPVQRSRLRHGDRISLGRTSFTFQRQNAE